MTQARSRAKVVRPLSILFASLFLVIFAAPSQGQLKFSDGTTQSTAFGGTNAVVSGTNATVAGGIDNTASGVQATVGGGSNNTAAGEASTVSGGFGNLAYQIDSTVGGGSLNLVAGASAVISGGTVNTADGVSSVIGGGSENIASADNATVSGGSLNEAAEIYASIGGGTLHLSNGDSSTIAGGFFNDANNLDATVGGGSDNIASGVASTIPGGSQNTAAGELSFATGLGATVDAAHDGATLFADSKLFFFYSDRSNEFAARATGGVRFVTAIHSITGEPTNGVKLNPGGGGWLNLSDRNTKENVEPVDLEAALDNVLSLPINTWNYKAQDDGLRHMGPMAQDFYAAFGLGSDDRHISTVDADGVSLAAIQGLYRRMSAEDQALRAVIHRRDAEIARLDEVNVALEDRLVELERVVRQLQKRATSEAPN